MVTEVDTKKVEKASGIAVSEDVNKDLKNKINKWRCLCQSPTQRSWDNSTGKKSRSSYTQVTGQPVQLFITGSFIYVNPHFFWPNDAPQEGGWAPSGVCSPGAVVPPLPPGPSHCSGSCPSAAAFGEWKSSLRPRNREGEVLCFIYLFIYFVFIYPASAGAPHRAAPLRSCPGLRRQCGTGRSPTQGSTCAPLRT